MAYTKQTWIDNSVANPVSAARMNYIEAGLEAAAAKGDALVAAGAIFSSNIGNNSATTFNISHTLGSTEVVAMVREAASPFRQVFPEVRVPDANTVQVIFDDAPTTNQYTITFFAGGITPNRGSNVYEGTVGNGVNTSFNIDHNFNTRALVVQVQDTTTNEVVVAATTLPTLNRVTVSFTVAPASDRYKVTIIAGAGTVANAPHAASHAAGSSDALSARSTRSVLEVGMANQTRAGRVLSVTDFTDMGLSTPVGLFSLSDTTNKGSGGALVNKGAVPFAPGITGAVGEAAQFAGSTSQALYIADTGAADPFRIRMGSWGCWFRTAKRGTGQQALAKSGAAANLSWFLSVTSGNVAQAQASLDGASLTNLTGVSDVADDRWHQATATFDGTAFKLYVDGVLESAVQLSGLIFAGAGSVNVGGFGADAATATANPFFGRVDEAFVTSGVISEDQVRMLYAVKVAHGLATAPRQADLVVRRRRRGALLATTDFPSTPLRLHNLNNSAADLGSNATPLTANAGTGVLDSSIAAGPDGLGAGGALYAAGTHAGMSSTDTGLPSGLATRSFGIWFKTTATTGLLLSWGGTPGSGDAAIGISNGNPYSRGSAAVGQSVIDGQWHHLVSVEDNVAADGGKNKLYLDGRLVSASTTINTVVLTGANRFRVGADATGAGPFTGLLARAFIIGGALTPEQIQTLYLKGSQQLAMSPKDAGDHIEGIDTANVYFVGDTLESQYLVDIGVTT